MPQILHSESQNHIQIAADILRVGGLVVFPTETVYGLAANALNAKALQKILDIKNRPADMPFSLHAHNTKSALKHIKQKNNSNEISSFNKLAKHFLPGPLTIIMKKNDDLPGYVTAGSPNIGIRIPSNATAQTLLKEAPCPIVATSVNLSGRPSPRNFKELLKSLEDMNGQVDAILIPEKSHRDSESGLASTIVDITKNPPNIIRQGSISKTDILQALTPSRT